MTSIIENNKDKYFKGQYVDEEVVTFFREHWIKLLPELIIFGAVVTVLTAFIFNFERIADASPSILVSRIILFLTVIAFGYFIHRFFWKIISYFLNTVILTNFRIVEVSKILFVIFVHDSQQTFDMKEIQDIQKKQDGFWKNILRFGTLIIMMSSSDIKTIKYVPNPDYHFRLVNRIKRTYIQRRVQHKDITRQHDRIEDISNADKMLKARQDIFLNDIVNLAESDSDSGE